MCTGIALGGCCRECILSEPQGQAGTVARILIVATHGNANNLAGAKMLHRDACMCPAFWDQTIETMVSEELEVPWETHAARGRTCLPRRELTQF